MSFDGESEAGVCGDIDNMESVTFALDDIDAGPGDRRATFESSDPVNRSTIWNLN